MTLPPISQRKLWLAVLDYQKHNEGKISLFSEPTRKTEFKLVDRQRSYTVTTAEDLPLHEKAWIKLRADLNLRLGGYVDIFKAKMQALIPADKWIEWGTTDAIDEALSYLRYEFPIIGS